MAQLKNMCALILGMALLLLASSVEAQLPPVVFVPGFTASDLLVKRTNVHSKYPFCKNNSGWSLLWPVENFDIKDNSTTLCWLEALQTEYDPSSGTFSGQPGFEVTTLDFGTFIGTTGGLTIIKNWEQLGWVVGKNIFAAPFDWRVPSSAMDPYFARLKALIEHAHAQTGQRVVLLAISFGPQVALSFLHRMTQQWKDEHIAWFVAESPVWSGAPLAVMSLISGVPLTGNVTQTGLYRALSLNIASLPWLFARAGKNSSTAWTADEVIVSTPARNYTTSDYPALFRDLGLANLVPGLEAILGEPDLGHFLPPMVDTLVTYGIDVNTSGYYQYDAPFIPDASLPPPFPAHITNMTETGDSVVPLRSSLRSAAEWTDVMAAAGKRLYHRAYPGQVHAYCIVPQGGPCFMDVVNLIRNGTIPPLTPAPAPHPHTPVPQIDAMRQLFSFF